MTYKSVTNSKLLNVDIDKWAHLNCALWSYDVYETLNGALMNVDKALHRGDSSECQKPGATLGCFKTRCCNIFHQSCGKREGCMVFEDKTIFCPQHALKGVLENELILPAMLHKPERGQADSEETEDNEVIFCSMQCYMQYTITRQMAPMTADTREAGNLVEHKSSASPNEAQTPPRSAPHTPQPTPPRSASQTPQPTPPKLQRIEDVEMKEENVKDATRDTKEALKEKAAKNRRRRSSASIENQPPKPLVKKWRDIRWRRWDVMMVTTMTTVPVPHDDQLEELWESMAITIRPDPALEDTRKCAFCHELGDGAKENMSRLLNVDIDKWAHLNCALWSYDVYETLNGALMNVDKALHRGDSSECIFCQKPGATLGCFKTRCCNIFHQSCGKREGCMFFEDKTIFCPQHALKGVLENELMSLVVYRRCYINRNEDKQIASMILQEEGKSVLRVGALVLHNVGQLLPHQIQTNKFNTREFIYPVGFRTTRFFWSMRVLFKRCRYICHIKDNDGRPEFCITVMETSFDDVTFSHSTPKSAWMNILEPLEKLRRRADLVKFFPNFISGEELFGLTDPYILRIIESLSGTDLLTNYNFKYGRSVLIEMPLAINPTGCVRTEPKLRTHFKRPHTVQTSNSSRSLPSTVTGVTGDVNSPYMKQFVHSKSQQYRRLKVEWKINVFLGRSRIQGLGLFAARDLEKHAMVIEYIGDLIRNEVANRREVIYESQNRGMYMFRIDNDLVVDATMAGGPARYINHACSPNCVAEVVPFEKESKIIIITSRRISQGEELTYDYKFDFEDDLHKIPCCCGSINCRKWMN